MKPAIVITDSSSFKMAPSTAATASAEMPPPSYPEDRGKSWSRADSAYVMSEVYQFDNSNNNKTNNCQNHERLCVRLCLLLLAVFLICFVVLAIVSAFSHAYYYRHWQLSSIGNFKNKVGGTGNNGETSTSSQSKSVAVTTTWNPVSAAPSGYWICVKHCFDSTYVLCPCDSETNCNCPMKSSRVDQDSQEIQDGDSQELNYDDDDDYFDFDESDEHCVAMCFPDFKPKDVACVDLLSACSVLQ